MQLYLVIEKFDGGFSGVTGCMFVEIEINDINSSSSAAQLNVFPQALPVTFAGIGIRHRLTESPTNPEEETVGLIFGMSYKAEEGSRDVLQFRKQLK